MVGRDLFPIRVQLPLDVTAVLLCEKDLTIERLLERALLQLQNAMGVSLDRATAKVVAEERPLDLKSALSSIPYIVDCISQRKGPPSLTIECSDPTLTEHEAAEEEASEEWDITNDYASFPDPVGEKPVPVPVPVPAAVPAATIPVTMVPLPAPIVQQPRMEEIQAAIPAPISAAEINATRPANVVANRTEEVRASTVYGKAHVPAQIYSVEFIFPGDAKFIWDFSGDSTIHQVKEDLWRLKENINAPDLKEHELYCLKFKGETGEQVELFDEQQLLQNVSMMPVWKKRGEKPVFILDFKKKAISKQEQLFNMKIGNLIGFGLYQFDYLKDQEVDTFRRRVERVRREALKDRDPFQYVVEPVVENFPASETVMKLATNGKIKMRIHLTFKDMDKTLLADVGETPRQLLEKFIPKNKLNLPENCTPDDFVLKVCGQNDYIAGEHKMIDFRYIRKCVLKEETANLSLISISSLNLSVKEYQEDNDLIEEAYATTASHEQLTVEGRDLGAIRNISLWDITRLFRVQVVGGENFSVGNVESLYVEIGLYHGGQPLTPTKKSPQVKSSGFPRWETWLNFDIATYNLPREARLCITVYGRWNAKKPMNQDKENDVYPLGWVNLLLMDFKGVLRQGLVKLHLWPGEKSNPIGCCISNPKTLESAALFLRFDSFSHPVIFPTEKYENEYKEYNKTLPPPTNDQDAALLEKIITSDPLTKLSDKAIALVWMYRFHCLRRPEALPKVLLSARWNLLEDVAEVRKMLLSWADLRPDVALELLDANFGDENVRAYAVSRLELLTDDQVVDYLVQLIQVLKYEPYHDNALSRFLLKRALRSKRVGHHFFWHLKAEMEQPEVSVRFALLLEAYLRGSPLHTDELIKQNMVIQKLSETALAIKGVKGAAEKKEMLVNKLSKLSLPDGFQLALNPKLEAKSLIIEKCKYMDSKKLPLWLVFENQDSIGKPVYIMFKSGDDLRQDMLTLQMISIMDKLWQQQNLDLRMIPYGCISTGNEIGMIEVVLNAETVSNIQQAYGGSTAAFRDTPLQEWIRAQNPNDEDYEKAVETFVLSCAGYCVATYILGIGDRHNDNIMVTKSGHLFHIDFGHFLGNIKRKFGIKRERAPFVLTPDFVYVMGTKTSERFARFQDICCQAYIILRRNAAMFINLFAMMLSTGIPELKSTEDIYYLRDALCLDKTEEEAAQEFRNLIFESLRLGWSTQLNWWIHNLAHAR